MARYVALLRTVNVGGRRVAMATARRVLEDLGYQGVGSYVSSGKTLGPNEWKRASPDNLTTARNMTMLSRLAKRL